jgi:signal transduction histidine kinase
VSEKDFDVRVDVPGDDELAGLARDFGRMTAELARFEALSVDELVRAKQALQSAIDSITDPVLVFEEGGAAVALANRAAGTLLHLEAGGELATLDDRPKLRTAIEKARASVLSGEGPFVPKSFDEAVHFEAPSGETWLLVRAMPITGSKGNVVGASVMLQDVTRWRRFDELRNDMVSTVAHELKTPLTSLQMAIGLVEDQIAGPTTAKQAELLRGAREDTERLRAMVAELLDLARLQAGRMELDVHPTAVGALLEDALAPHRSAAESKDVALVAEAAADLPELACDVERVKIVFANLVSNAIRYTPAGGRVLVRAKGATEGIAFEVEDTGKGIPAEHRPHVFDKFFRVPGSPKGGAGLGLWITREIVEAHGGTIAVGAGAEGQGTRFSFTLPLEPAPRTRA